MLKRVLKALYLTTFLTVVFISLVVSSVIIWYRNNFGERLTMLIFTLKHAEGANMEIVKEVITSCIPSLIVWLLISWVAILMFIKKEVSKSAYLALTGFAVIALAIFAVIAEKSLKVYEYYESRYAETDLYEKYYVIPDASAITSSVPKNLIYVYMESMETAFASESEGGHQKDVNYIPNLTDLAAKNISFSNSDKLGGFYQVNGKGWTAAATFASMTGVPYLASTTDISSGLMALPAIGNILTEKGYYLEYICGSDADFSGRRTFFGKHGDYTIMDYQAAIDKGYIDEDYYVWWGYEDRKLYEIAESEITEAANHRDTPFDITILTVDTHYTDGYLCDLCDWKYDDRYANVISCADNQISDFLSWCMEQDWYDDTVIIIQGDHPYMRKSVLLNHLRDSDRTTYDCFINTGYDPGTLNLHNRVFTCMDMFPTTLAAIGFEIPENRLALGTNLFSDRPTLAEEIGLKKLDAELNKHSEWYMENAANEYK